MPAYRSQDEADIRIPVVERLREMVPGCRIIHEVNAASFGNRIDVMAVGASEIISVEIKSAKDKLDRLPDQIKAMERVSHRAVVALHEKFLRDMRGESFPPDEAGHKTIVWVYPKVDRKGHIYCGSHWHEYARWEALKKSLPSTATDLLWREELAAICNSLGIKTAGKTMPVMLDEIRWRMTGEQITRAICSALRSRKCAEADEPMTGLRAA